MDKFRTVAPIILMLLTALVVFYANVSLSGSGFGGTILFVMIVGFVAAAIMYHDMRTFINEQTRALSEINLRLSNLEQQSRK